MAAEPVVAAVGHSFPGLEIESAILGARNIELIDANKLSAAELGERGVSGVLLGLARRLDRSYLDRVPELKAIVRYGIGVDNVDLAAADERGIVVCNVPDYCVEEVAVHVLACALALARALGHWDANVRAGAWRAGPRPALRRLSKCTLGIIGFGRIGRSLAVRAERIFGAIVVHDPWRRADDAQNEPKVEFAADLDELLARADVVSVHTPLTPETEGLIGAAALSRMKPGAYVLNASRGGIVDEAALLEALQEGRIAGAALDAFSAEPLPQDHPLIKERRVLLSPHIAWLSEEAELELRRSAAEEVARVLLGEPPHSRVNAG